MIRKMASGNLCITLVENVDEKDFVTLAGQWAKKLGATVIGEAFNFDVQLLRIRLFKEEFYLAWDIWQNALTLESMSDNGNKIINNLKI